MALRLLEYIAFCSLSYYVPVLVTLGQVLPGVRSTQLQSLQPAASQGLWEIITYTDKRYQGCESNACKSWSILAARIWMPLLPMNVDPIQMTGCLTSFKPCSDLLYLLHEFHALIWREKYWFPYRLFCGIYHLEMSFTNANWSSACPVGDRVVGILIFQTKSWNSDLFSQNPKKLISVYFSWHDSALASGSAPFIR